jgi:phospholipid/cholesterol/gamma-HCH transport system substrate-binding protein
MEREANYLAVGSFVLLVLVVGILFVYWYSGANERLRHFQRYEIYFDGSVSGLSEGGPVRYMGVDVGRVETIGVDPRASNRVQVLADIVTDTPVSSHTVAQLSLQGITGVMYIDLRQLSPLDSGRRLLANVPSQRYPVIPSVHSDLDLFLGSLPDLASRLNDLIDRASGLLSQQNVDALHDMVANLNKATAGLPQSARELQELLKTARDTVDEMRQLVANLHGASQTASVDVVAAVQKLRATSDNLASASARLDAFVAHNGDQVSGLVSDAVPQLESLLRESRTAITQINELARTLNDNPSRLLYQPKPHGVAIPP